MQLSLRVHRHAILISVWAILISATAVLYPLVPHKAPCLILMQLRGDGRKGDAIANNPRSYGLKIMILDKHLRSVTLVRVLTNLRTKVLTDLRNMLQACGARSVKFVRVLTDLRILVLRDLCKMLRACGVRAIKLGPVLTDLLKMLQTCGVHCLQCVLPVSSHFTDQSIGISTMVGLQGKQSTSISTTDGLRHRRIASMLLGMLACLVAARIAVVRIRKKVRRIRGTAILVAATHSNEEPQQMWLQHQYLWW